jgi:hypothetical protein
MKAVKVSVLIDDHEVPRRYRGLLRELEHHHWSRAELRWMLRAHPQLPPLVKAVVWQKLRRR